MRLQAAAAAAAEEAFAVASAAIVSTAVCAGQSSLAGLRQGLRGWQLQLWRDRRQQLEGRRHSGWRGGRRGGRRVRGHVRRGPC